MKKKPEQHTHPFADLSRYGVDSPFLSDEEIASLTELRNSPAWMALLKTRAHLLTIYGRKSLSAAKAGDPAAFKLANIADGIELYTVVVDALTRGEPIPDITQNAAVGARQGGFAPEDDL